jgi:hypothetical protein
MPVRGFTQVPHKTKKVTPHHVTSPIISFGNTHVIATPFGKKDLD